MRKSFRILFLLAILLSCRQPIVSFDEPQPEKTKSICTFPTRLVGNYYNPSNNTEIIISKDFIFKKMTTNDTLNLRDVSENEKIKNDTLFKNDTGEKYPIKKINDSLFTNYVYSDTIFKIGKKSILKKFRQSFFLNNYREKLGAWEVTKIAFYKGILNISNIETEKDLNLMEEITETKYDTVKPFKVKPTKRQFKKFIKQNGFSSGENYLRI